MKAYYDMSTVYRLGYGGYDENPYNGIGNIQWTFGMIGYGAIGRRLSPQRNE